MNEEDFTKIMINDERIKFEPNYSDDYRGMHIVLINSNTGKIVHKEIFDTSNSSEKLEEWIGDGLPDGFIVVVAWNNECT